MSAGNGLLRFDPYDLNPETGELRKGGTPLKLPPQPAKVLALLASRPGELVTREELQRELWGDQTLVDFDRGLNFCIRRVRAVLLDDATEPRYIETVPRRGYRFIAPVQQVSTVPRRRWWPRPVLAVGVLAAVALALMFANRGAGRSVSPEVYAQYRKGRFLAEEFEARQNKSIEYYQDAIARDPGYAPAYAGLAYAYVVHSWLKPELPARDYLAKAKSAALKSLELDPQVALGHTALGYFLGYDWQWARAEQEYRKAIALAPNDPDAHDQFSLLLSSLGRHEEALREARLAAELDPVSAVVSFNLAHDLWMARRYDEAIAQSRRVLELHPETRLAYNVIGHCYAQKRMYQEAEAAFREFQPDIPPAASPWRAYVLALAGRKPEAESIIQAAQAPNFRGPQAQCYAALGDHGRALDWLEQAFARHESSLVWAKVRPEYDSLHAEPRFAALLQKMGFTP